MFRKKMILLLTLKNKLNKNCIVHFIHVMITIILYVFMFALTNLDKIDGFKIMCNFIYIFRYCIEQNREDACHTKDILCCFKKPT